MKINLKATNIELTPMISDYIEDRINQLDKYIDCAGESVQVWVEMEKTMRRRSGDIFRAELQFRLPQKGVRAESKSDNWRSAFNQARKKARRELQKYKDKKC
jgi:ribosomal subunit interface protein